MIKTTARCSFHNFPILFDLIVCSAIFLTDWPANVEHSTPSSCYMAQTSSHASIHIMDAKLYAHRSYFSILAAAELHQHSASHENTPNKKYICMYEREGMFPNKVIYIFNSPPPPPSLYIQVRCSAYVHIQRHRTHTQKTYCRNHWLTGGCGLVRLGRSLASSKQFAVLRRGV